MALNEQQKASLSPHLVRVVRGAALLSLAAMLRPRLAHRADELVRETSPAAHQGFSLLSGGSVDIWGATTNERSSALQGIIAVRNSLPKAEELIDLTGENTVQVIEALQQPPHLLRRDLRTMEQAITQIHTSGHLNVRCSKAPCAILYHTGACFSQASS